MNRTYQRSSLKTQSTKLGDGRNKEERNSSILKDQQKQKMDKMYQDNLKLGYKINSLTDQNNFYRIQINNIKKLNKNINKDLNRFIENNNQVSRNNNDAKSNNYIESMLMNGNTKLSSAFDLKLQSKTLESNQKANSFSKYGKSSNLNTQVLNQKRSNDINDKIIEKENLKIERSAIGQKNIINYFGYQSSATTPMNYNQYFCENERNEYNNNVSKLRSRNAYTRSINSFHHNMKYKNEINNSNAVEPLFCINNRIKLKNLQMKVGNSIRQAEKLKKQYDGSLSTLAKRTVILQEDVNQHARKLERIMLENQMLSNIYLADHYECVYKQLFATIYISNRQLIRSEQEIRILQAKQAQLFNRLQRLKKEQKGYKKTKGQLDQEIKLLSGQVQNLRKQNPQSVQIKHIRAVEVVQLQRLQTIQKKLLREIEQQDIMLQEQYKMNQECKQKIVQRKQQQNKQIKMLQEEVNKCQEQVKQIKQKHRDLVNFIKNTPFAGGKTKKKAGFNINK